MSIAPPPVQHTTAQLRCLAHSECPHPSLLLDVVRCVVCSVAANVGFVQADILSWRPPPSLHGCVDCVLSDVMSRTTGVADIDAASSAALVSRVLVLSSWLCMPRGRVLAKVFASSHVDGLLAQFSEQFADVRVCKPAASRKESKEVYILASGKKQSIVTAARSG